ncbi:MAG: hypothetical protein WAT66_10265 [Actinomycetota bacterium]
MKMEEHFKQTLNRAVANEPPVLDAWDRFEQRAGRGRRVRLFAGIAAAAAVAIASVIVVPKLATNRAIDVPPATQPPSPTPTVTRDVYAGWESGRRTTDLYEVRWPQGWSGFDPAQPAFEGVDAIQPPNVEPLEKGEPTFAVTIKFEQGATPSESASGEQLGEPTRSTRADGRTQYRLERATPGEGRSILYLIEWTACARGETPCRQVSGTLFVRIIAGTDPLWQEHGATGELIAASVRHVDRSAGSPSR